MSGKKPARFERLFVSTLLAVGVAALGWGFAAKHFQPQKSPYPPAKYSRADCIVRIDIAYPEGLSYDDKDYMGKIMMESFTDEIIRYSLPVAGHGPGHTGHPEFRIINEKHYTQFTDLCEHKTAMAQQMVARFENQYFARQAAAEPGQISPYVIEGRLKPRLIVSEEKIEPSVETIMYGNNDLLSPPIWTDVDDR